MKPASHCASNPAPPSAVGATSAGSSWMSSAIVSFHGWRARISSLIQAMNDQPSGQCRRRVARDAVDRADEQRRVEAQAVALELLEPGQGAVAQERADLAAAVVGPGRAPRRDGPFVVVEVDPAAAVRATSRRTATGRGRDGPRWL